MIIPQTGLTEAENTENDLSELPNSRTAISKALGALIEDLLPETRETKDGRQYLVYITPGLNIHRVPIAGLVRTIELPAKFYQISDQQFEVLDKILAAYEQEDVRMVIVQAPPGVGKEQPLISPILTPSGWQTMGDMQIGSQVFDQEGKVCNVAAVHPQGIKPVYRVSFNDKTEVLCGLEHLWKVARKDNRTQNPWRVKALKEIIPTFQSGKKGGMPSNVYRIPITDPIKFEDRELPLDPYFMGLLLGNGGMTSHLTFSSNDEQLVQAIRDFMPPDVSCKSRNDPRNPWDYNLAAEKNGYGNSLIKILKRVGLMFKGSAEKFIPECYMFSGVQDRLAILQGLMDTDGHAIKQGGVDYVSASRELRDGAAWLVRSLGGISRIGPSKWVKGKEYFRVNLKPPMNPFRLIRKRDTWVEPTKYPCSKVITNIEYVGEMECQCITVNSPTHTYLTNDCTVTHNTLLAEITRQCLDLPMLYLPPHIELQKQFIRDFERAVLLNGRSNFPHGGLTGERDFPRITCKDCVESNLCSRPGEGGVNQASITGQEVAKKKKIKTNCKYSQRKNQFCHARVGVANLSYFLHAANGINMFVPRHKYDPEKTWGKFTGDEGRHLDVIDECDVIEESLKGFLSVELTNFRREQIDSFCQVNAMDAIEYAEQYRESAWPKPPLYDQEKRAWDYLKLLRRHLSIAANIAIRVTNKYKVWIEANPGQSGKVDQAAVKRMRTAEMIISTYTAFARIEINEDGEASDWIYQPTRAEKGGKRVGEVVKVSFLPVRVDKYADELLWDHMDKILVMSGTIISKEVFLEECGIELAGINYRYVETPNRWDRFRSPVYRMRGVNVVKNMKNRPWKEQECWTGLLANACYMIQKQAKQNLIIHTVSFELARELGEELEEVFGAAGEILSGGRVGRILTHRGDRVELIEENGVEKQIKIEPSVEKEILLTQFKEAAYLEDPPGLVIISPSLERGVDCPGKECEGVGWAKCPWGDLSNRVVSKRKEQKTGWHWFNVQVARKLLQGSFRGLRWAGDSCRIWLMDEQFDRILEAKVFIYKWFSDRLKSPGVLTCPPIPEYKGGRG